MKLIQSLLIVIAFLAILGGYSEKPIIEPSLQADKTYGTMLNSYLEEMETSSTTLTSWFSLKEYVRECSLLTSNQSLCHELGESLQHTLKSNMTEDPNGNL